MSQNQNEVAFKVIVESPELISADLEELILSAIPNGFNFYLALVRLVDVVMPDHDEKNVMLHKDCAICDALNFAVHTLLESGVDLTVSLHMS